MVNVFNFSNFLLIQWFEMVILFLKVEDFKKNVKTIKGCDLVVFGFCDNTPLFLSSDYYFFVNKLKKLSLKTKTQFILTFYIPKLNRKYVGAVRICGGKIVNLFGECFTKKHLSFKLGNKLVSVLFYYDLYSKWGKDVNKFSSVIIGLDDDELLDDVAFLDNKFFNKLVLVNKNLKINCGKLKIFKNKLKMCENVFYKI